MSAEDRAVALVEYLVVVREVATLARRAVVDLVAVGRKIVVGALQVETAAPSVVEVLRVGQGEVAVDLAEAAMKEEMEALEVAVEPTVQLSESHNRNNHGPVRIYPRPPFRPHRRRNIHY